MEELRRGIPRAMILKHIEDSYLTRFMDEHDIYDPDLARQLFSAIPTPRGAWATMQDVYNRQRKLDLATWMRDVSELRSLLKWYLDETAPVVGLMFEIPGGNPDDDNCDFNLGFSFPSCIDVALKWANGKPIMMDSTHGTNHLGCSMTTLIAVDGHGNGHPLAWFFTKRETAENLTKFLDAFNKEVGSHALMPCVVFLGSFTSTNSPYASMLWK